MSEELKPCDIHDIERAFGVKTEDLTDKNISGMKIKIERENKLIEKWSARV